MTPKQIAALVAGGESETLEFKNTTGTRREAVMTMCAFLNQSGGYVLFGVTPEGTAVGQKTGQRTIEELSDEIARIEPPAFPTVDRIRIQDDREVIAVSVDQGPVKPYLYRGAAYCRVGNTTRVLSADEYNRMLFERMHSEQRWENRPATGWLIEDLDETEIRRTVEEAVRRGRLAAPGTREPAEMLRGLGLFRGGDLLRAATVLFGRPERLEFEMPQCLLRVARFKGVDRAEFMDNRQFHGNAFALLAHAERFLLDTLPIAGRVEASRFERIDEPLYPPLATREALANAFCHRDYSIGGGSIGIAVYDDRLEVTSSGTLHFGLTPEKLFAPHESLPWNPLIARTFYRRGIIEEWGIGTLKMAEVTVSSGLPRPKIEERSGCVTVCFQQHVRQPQRREAADRRQEILSVLDKADRPLALREIRSLLGSIEDVRRLRYDLTKLKSQGLAVCVGNGRGAGWKRP